MCFDGDFEALRAKGRQQSRWLLVNIQSPVEFDSQRLNRDTWTNESLRAVVDSSFYFWQQYHDSAEGETYCRRYLRNAPKLPHIGVIDPVTGQLIKSWTNFTDAERLMDKLMDYADAPPKDIVVSSPPHAGGAAADGADGGGLGAEPMEDEK